MLGIGSWTFAWAVGVPGIPPEHPLTPIGLLDKAAELGVHVLQVCDNLPLARLSEKELSAFQHHAARLGTKIEVGTRGISYDNLRTYRQLAQRLHSRILRVVIDTADHRPAPGEIVSALKGIIGEFEAADVVLAIENHDRFKSQTLAGIIADVNSPALGICLDVFNSLAALEGPEVVVSTLAPWTVNLHIKDVVVRRNNANMGFVVEGRPVGQGQLDVPWVLAHVKQAERLCNTIIEQWPAAESSLEATIAKEAEWAAAGVGYMRQFIHD